MLAQDLRIEDNDDLAITLSQEAVLMKANKNFEPDIETAADFLHARTALQGDRHDKPVVILDFSMLDFEPSPTTVGLVCSLDDTRKLVRTCLVALESFGDQPASVLMKILRQKKK